MKLKKFLASILAVTMVTGTCMTTWAAGSGSAAPAAPSAPTVEATGSVGSAAPSAPTVNVAGDAAQSGASAQASVAWAAESVKGAGAAVTIAGTSIKTTMAGSYAAKTIQGMAIITPADSIRSSLNLGSGQTPYIIVFDTDAKKSYLAMNCVNAAAEAMGAHVVTALNIDLGAKSNGKYVRLASGSVGAVIGLPKGVDTTKTVSVICVRPGGVITILPDTDTNPNTVTFEIQAGLGTYAIVTK